MKNPAIHSSGLLTSATSPEKLNSKIRKAFSRGPWALFVMLLSVSLLLQSQSLNAQAPQQFSFQGVARDASGKILVNKSITIGFNIFKGGPNGSIVFDEIHNATTNSNGIFNLQIGSVTSLNSINWENDSYFLRTAMFYDGLPGAVDLGTTQLLSVPYALHALKSISAAKSTTSDTAVLAKKWIDDEPIIQTGSNGVGSPLPNVPNGNMLIWYPKNAAFRVGVNNGDHWNRATMGVGSFATGNGTLASGENSAGFGKDTEATGKSAFALGSGAKAFGDYSFAAGNSANASGVNSAAIGQDVIASGSNSIAIGFNSKATDVRSIAIGNGAESSGQDAVAIGYNAKATHTNALAFGNSSEATGQNSVSFGNSIASSLRSFAVGEGILAKAVDGVAFGTYNNSGDFPGAQAAATDRLFQIGNGASATRSNAMTVLRNGNIGIGNNVLTPEYIMDFGGRPRVRHNGATAGIHFNNSQNQIDGFVGMVNDNEVGFYVGNAWRFIVSNNGNVYATHYSNFSDLRLKTDIKPIQNSLVNIRNIQGCTYLWKDSKSNQNLQTGVIAQEVEKWFPELVSVAQNGYKAVNYIGLIPHLIEAVKELDKKTEEITALKKELATMQELNKKLSALEANVKMLLAGHAETTSQTGK